MCLLIVLADVESIMEPKGIECYSVASSVDLKFPFSKYHLAQLESIKALVEEDTSRLEADEGNLDEVGNLSPQAQMEQLVCFRKYADQILDNNLLTSMKKYLKNDNS